jgi:hypothetical protein
LRDALQDEVRGDAARCCGHLSRTDAVAAAQSLLDLSRLNTVASHPPVSWANRLN